MSSVLQPFRHLMKALFGITRGLYADAQPGDLPPRTLVQGTLGEQLACRCACVALEPFVYSVGRLLYVP
jgi:hypothetical protein